jgi:uncharacterized protein Yka (UPF0111/DUF47 family)
VRKDVAVTSLGASRLLLPAWVKAALAANDRLKAYLTVLQAAWTHALHPDNAVPDLSVELAAAGLGAHAFDALVGAALPIDDTILLTGLPGLVQSLADDLATMARPVLATSAPDGDLPMRTRRWLDWLARLAGERLGREQIEDLTRGRRGEKDSLHLLVMDLHKQINGLAGSLASEVIDGANVWELRADDRLRVTAFMRGLHRTAALKFDHPGLDTAATRDGEQLLLQNDIGTNDAHVLVMRITGTTIVLTYSDLHRGRLDFFASLLSPYGAVWSNAQSHAETGLNQGAAFTVATATFPCKDPAALDAALEGIGSRIVFLIDWNRARKRLEHFVTREVAIAVLADAAHADVGHRAWLQMGGERLVYSAMQAAGEGTFRIGDRLDEVIGVADARAFLVAVLRLACDGARGGQPPALVADETRMLLAQRVRQRTSQFDLLLEHASYCQALAQAVSDGLAHGAELSQAAADALARRSKLLEHKADQLVVQARETAARQRRWQPVALLVEKSDDVADALEEAAFLMSLIAGHAAKGWNEAVRTALGLLAASVLQATQDQVKALAIARSLGSAADADAGAGDDDAFLAATWRVLQAERQCDTLLRHARRVILGTLVDPPLLLLANDLAVTLEMASDRLLDAAYALRDLAFHEAGVAG